MTIKNTDGNNGRLSRGNYTRAQLEKTKGEECSDEGRKSV